MGSPPPPIVANLYIDDFDGQSLHNFSCKPGLWIKYVDGIFSVLPFVGLLNPLYFTQPCV